MEVHHHPQLNHNPKPWKEYLLEFLMIFLAVTMGFFAESIREHITDDRHIKQFTVSLVTELKHDTSQLAFVIKVTKKRQQDLDTLFFLLQRPMAGLNTYKLQQLVQASSALTMFSPENGTVTQLKNSGSLRLLGETQVPYYIGRCEGLLNVTRALETTDVANEAKYIDGFESQHFTPENLFILSKMVNYLKAFTPANKNMRNITRENLTQFGNDLMVCKQNSGYLLAYYLRDKDEAVKFIKYLQKEYHLTDD